jgi:hypothetical protein
LMMMSKEEKIHFTFFSRRCDGMRNSKMEKTKSILTVLLKLYREGT